MITSTFEISGLASLLKVRANADNAFTIYIGDSNSEQTLFQVMSLAALLRGCEDFYDVVPANNNITVFYDPIFIGYKQAKSRLESLLTNEAWLQECINDRNIVSVPVFYGGELALDLVSLSKELKLELDEIIEIHSRVIYQVTAVGFAPGFAYMDGVSERIRLPRKTTPRTFVPKGALAIAEGQTAIYPTDSPGGWHIIGHCPIPMFDLSSPDISRLSVGDRVKFQSVSQQEYQSLLKQG
ncbi:5-oxoprolinase subunit PxpB [Paraneptunicella aestuarii]|uniref:5-oxoprolinase subunit PxpB n=1 Tax=Paraneptunicella aestuarii TaxID=2831148 RepID=UPI001E4FB3F1|nr:5-oxoprolinase subunit PxpB [Paraneptunicella aestuarii]UAA37280.1 5-oxoprolinase subunit PxpB [Paraneptunicella aestuarii]